MIYIRTYAYNAERTLRKTIESILNQTHKEFTYYILENGSTDGTRKIVKEYAEKDSRIVAFYSDKNFDRSINPAFWGMVDNLSESDFFCTLDADDTYESTFLEEMKIFLENNRLGLAACGTTFIDAETGEKCGERVLMSNCVVHDGESFEAFFPMIHWNLRQSWGKLYTAKAAKARFEKDFPEWYPKAYGGDTISVYESVKSCDRIGVYGKALHTYLISTKSVSYRWADGREKSDFILYEKAIELLNEKCGRVSENNRSFLCAVQYHALIDTLNVLFGSDLSVKEKSSLLNLIFENPITQQIFLFQGGVSEEEKKRLLEMVACRCVIWLQEKMADCLSEMGSVFSIFNVDFLRLITLDELEWYATNVPIVIRNIALHEYEYALNNLVVYIVKEKEQKINVDFPIMLSQKLAALLNDEKKYVFFSKLLIIWCIENNQQERACRDIEEWLQILPEDEDLKRIQRMRK